MTADVIPWALDQKNGLGMRVGVRYIVTRSSKNNEFQVGDRIWVEPDGDIMCPAAGGWMPADDVPVATCGMLIEEEG